MCNWSLYWFDHDRPESLPAVAEDLARIFLPGVLGAQAPAPAPAPESEPS